VIVVADAASRKCHPNRMSEVEAGTDRHRDHDVEAVAALKQGLKRPAGPFDAALVSPVANAVPAGGAQRPVTDEQLDAASSTDLGRVRDLARFGPSGGVRSDRFPK